METNNTNNLTEPFDNIDIVSRDDQNGIFESSNTVQEEETLSPVLEEITTDDNGDKYIEITVSDPQKVGDGIGSFLAYKVSTKTNIPKFKKKQFNTLRRFSDFLGLYEILAGKYLRKGRIIPPAPEKNLIGSTKVKMSQQQVEPGIGLNLEWIENRRASLERYLNRTAQHPVLRCDVDFINFLESDEELPRAVNTAAFFKMNDLNDQQPPPNIQYQQPNIKGKAGKAKHWQKQRKPKQVEQKQPQQVLPQNKTGIHASNVPLSDIRPSMFKAMAVATSSSTPRDNEILKDKSILVEGAALTPRISRSFSNDYTQFFEIVRESYKLHTKLDKRFREAVSLSMYEYYCTILLYRRIFYILQARNQIDAELYIRFIAQLPVMSIPAEIGQYLDAIGDIIDPAGVKYNLKLLSNLASTPKLKSKFLGHFGQISANNHCSYETTPAVIVLIERIAHDILLTTDDAATPMWTPTSIAVPTGHVSPTENLLGWKLAQTLTNTQLMYLHEFGFTTGRLPPPANDPNHIAFTWDILNDMFRNVANITILRELLQHISQLLFTAKTHAEKMKYSESTNVNGSISQTMYHYRTVCDPITSNEIPMITRHPAVGNSYHQIGIQSISAAIIFRYRYKRVTQNTIPDMLSYLRDDGTALQGWIDTADAAFNTLNGRPWNISDFVTSESLGDKRANEYISKVYKLTE